MLLIQLHKGYLKFCSVSSKTLFKLRPLKYLEKSGVLRSESRIVVEGTFRETHLSLKKNFWRGQWILKDRDSHGQLAAVLRYDPLNIKLISVLSPVEN